MDGCILDRNDQVKRHNEGGEAVEVIEVLEQAVNGAGDSIVKSRQFVRHVAVLETDKKTLLVLDQGSQSLKLDGASISPGLVSPAAPRNPDLQPGACFLRQQRFPMIDSLWVRTQIGHPWK